MMFTKDITNILAYDEMKFMIRFPKSQKVYRYKSTLSRSWRVFILFITLELLNEFETFLEDNDRYLELDVIAQ